MNSDIKYIELKIDGLRGIGRIVRVTFSNSGKTIYYENRTLAPLKGFAAKANFYDEESFEEFWVSNPSSNGDDSLFPTEVKIDDEIREEYWNKIRKEPNNVKLNSYKSPGKSKKTREAVEKAVRRHNMDRRFRAP